MSQFGKWGQAGVPHKGWTCVDIEDLGSPDMICEMCERQEIRYVHYMKHPNYPGMLGTGCDCAGKMEEDYQAAQQRERIMQNSTQRRSRWLSRRWRTSAKENPFLNTDGFNIVLYPTGKNLWGGRIADHETEEQWRIPRRCPTLDQAKLAAFDLMIQIKNSRDQYAREALF